MPTRYQDRTDREVYENFKEECSEKVKVEMAKVGQEMRNKLVKRIDSVDKQRRLEYAHSLSELFPSLDWFIKQRPAETKPLCDHTTGLCHLCEAARKNFSTIVQAAKTRCSCNTRMCPNWSCVCPVVDDDQEQAPCVCPPCECEDCLTCQVNSDLFVCYFCTFPQTGISSFQKSFFYFMCVCVWVLPLGRLDQNLKKWSTFVRSKFPISNVQTNQY